MNIEIADNDPPEDELEAWYQLMHLNLTSHQPKVEAWLHSEEADPVLRQLLVNVPCAGLTH